jgi:predicted dehydrogenase
VSLHYAVALDSLRAGLHTLVEKPLANRLVDAATLVREARTRGLQLAVGHVERFNPAVRELKRRIDRGELGDLKIIAARRVGTTPVDGDVDIVVDLAIHDVDIAIYLVGRSPVHVRARANRMSGSERFDGCQLLLEFGSVTGSIVAAWSQTAGPRTLVATGSAGRATLDYVAQTLSTARESPGFDPNRPGSVFLSPAIAEPEAPPAGVRCDALRLELNAFVRAVLGTGRFEVSGAEALAALAVVERARNAIMSIDARAVSPCTTLRHTVSASERP